MPDVHSMRIPVKYLANMLTAGDEKPVVEGLEKLLAMRGYMRSVTVEKNPNTKLLEKVSLTEDQVQEMYQLLAIANYEDRYVIPSTHKEDTLDAYNERGSCGFSFGNGCSNHSNNDTDFFEAATPGQQINRIFVRDHYQPSQDDSANPKENK